MSSGEQPCQHPPGECPCPPGALTQLTGEVWEGVTPHHRAALQPAWLTHTICSGLRDRASGQHGFCTHTRMAFVSHDCLWLAYCFPSVCDCRESVFHVPRRRKNKTLQNLAVCWNAWQLCSFAARGRRLLKNSSDFPTYRPWVTCVREKFLSSC